MKTKILYVLVTTGEDIYAEQALLSVHSLRRREPEAFVTLLTDRLSRDVLAAGEGRLACFDEVVVHDLDPALSPMTRSRLLKTGMRNYVDGDFLYIDTDTLICRPLRSIDEVDADLAACYDLHNPLEAHTHRDAIVSLCARIGFDVSAERDYFNGGVMLVRDTPATHAFFAAWQAFYREGARAGVHSDQPSLAQANAATGHPLRLLPDVWNCQAMSGVRYLGGAIIFHYLCTNAAPKENGLLYRLHDREELLRLRTEGYAPFEDLVEDPLQGFAPSTLILSGEDLYFLRTRRYRWLRGRFQRGRMSLLEFLLKVRDHLTGAVR